MEGEGNTVRVLTLAVPTERVVKHTNLGQTGKYVTTVCLGSQTFESVVFGPKDEELATRRYATLLQACAGHEELCRVWRKPRAQRRARQ